MIRARFEGPLDTRKIGERDGRPLWRLLAPLVYQSAVLASRLVVPSGFVTDMASVPRLPFAFLLAGDTAHAPAVVHDFLYQVHLPDVPRAQADATFTEAMGCDQPEFGVVAVPSWRRALMGHLVRIAGGRAWATGPARLWILNAGLAGAGRVA